MANKSSVEFESYLSSESLGLVSGRPGSCLGLYSIC